MVTFPPWHGGGKVYEILVRRLYKHGNSVLAYYFHDDILTPDIKSVKKSFTFLRDTISAEIHEITTEHSYNQIKFVGLSLGNVICAMVTDKFRDFDSVVFCCTASSLADCMWYGIRTKNIREIIEKNGYKLSDVRSMWDELAPGKYVDALAGKKTDIIVSSTDTIIPVKFQREYVRMAQKAGIKPTIHTTRLGHIASVVKECVFS